METPRAYDQSLRPKKGLVDRILTNTYYRQGPSSYLGNAVGGLSSSVFLDGKSKMVALGVGAISSMLFAGSTVEEMASNSNKIGKHTLVHVRKYKGLRNLKSSDGVVIKPGEKIGTIDVIRNIRRLQTDDSAWVWGRKLYKEAKNDLGELARLCMADSPEFDGVKIFGGASSIVGKLTERLGFETFPIKNPIKRKGYEILSKAVAENALSRHSEWIRRDGSAKFAYISREKLIELYGK